MTDRSPDSNVIAKLRALDSALEARGVPREASERIGHALQERALERRFAARLRWWPALAFAAGAGLMAAALLYGGERMQSKPTPELVEAPPGLDSVGTEAVIEPPSSRCRAAQAGVGELAAVECVEGDGVRISGLIASRYEWGENRVELVSGELMFEVESRPERPLVVVVGEAEIEVIGTSFVVHRDAGGGWISLLEGHVRVRVGEQSVVDLRAGEQLEWTPKQAAVEPAPSVPVPAAQREDEGLAELLEEVAMLRRAGEYQAAVDRLRAGDRKGWSSRGRQLVSYEIGSLLERQLGDRESACKHWAGHRKRWPKGRYEAIVGRSMARLECE